MRIAARYVGAIAATRAGEGVTQFTRMLCAGIRAVLLVRRFTAIAVSTWPVGAAVERVGGVASSLLLMCGLRGLRVRGGVHRF